MADPSVHRPRSVNARLRRLLLIPLGALLLALGIGGYWLLATEAGLRFVVERVDAMDNIGLSARQWRGRLIGPAHAEELVVDTRATRITAAQASVDWRPLGLLRGRLVIDPLEARDLRVELKPLEPAAERRRARLPPLFTSLGVRGQVHGFTLVGREGNVLFAPTVVAAEAIVHHDLRLTVERAALVHARGAVEMSGSLGVYPEDPVALTTEWSGQLPGVAVPMHGTGTVHGVLGELRFDQRTDTPWRGHLQGSLSWIGRPPAWQASLRVERGNLAALDPSWRAVGVAGQVEGRGVGRELELTADLDLSDPQAGPWRSRATLQYGAAGWRLPTLFLAQEGGPGQLVGSGVLALEGRNKVDLELAWRDLAWPVAKPGIRSPSGNLTVHGNPDAYTLAGAAALVREGRPPGRLELAGKGDRRQLKIERLTAGWLGGKLAGRGQVRWSPTLRFEGNVSIADLDPGQLAPDWPGRLDAELNFSGGGAGARRELRIDLSSLGGQLRGHALDGQARLAFAPGTLRIDALALTSGTARLNAAGALAASSDMNFSLQAPDLQHLLPKVRGSLSLEGRLRGTSAAPRLNATVRGTGLQWRSRHVAELEAAIALDMSGRELSTAQARAQGVVTEKLSMAALTFSGEGRPAAHRIGIEAQLALGTAKATAEGRYRNGAWQGLLRDGGWIGEGANWEQEGPAELWVARDGVRLAEACWAQGTARVCAAGAGGRQGIEVRARAVQVPLQVFNPWLPRQDLSVTGALNGSLALVYRDGLRRLQAGFRAEKGGFLLDLPGDEVLAAGYRHLSLEAEGSQAGFRLRAEVAMEDGDFARAEARLPTWRPGGAFAGELPVQGRAEASLGQLVWVSLFVPEVIVPDGRLKADLELRGTVERPVLAGTAGLTGGSVAIPLLGIELSQLRFFLQGSEAGRMQIQVAARSGPGHAELSGTVARAPEGWLADLRLTGKDFEVVKLPVGEALASPDVAIRLRSELVEVTGKVLIPRARVAMEDIAAPVQASADVVVVDREEEIAVARRRWRVVTEVELVFGDEVHVEGYGLEGRLGGRLTVLEPLSGGATARGEVTVLDGKYEAYGQNLTIAQGRLLYTNAPIANPGIDFRAVREVEDVTVGIAASGRLKTPEVRLYSEPPMDDSQVLAYIVLGRPIDTASREEADLLQRAAVSLGLAGGTQLAREIAGEFGVDVVEVETSTQGQEAALVLGKYLSPRLYVQYAVGLFQTTDSLRMRYELTEHWTLEAQSGTRSSADLLFTIEK